MCMVGGEGGSEVDREEPHLVENVTGFVEMVTVGVLEDDHSGFDSASEDLTKMIEDEACFVRLSSMYSLDILREPSDTLTVTCIQLAQSILYQHHPNRPCTNPVA